MNQPMLHRPYPTVYLSLVLFLMASPSVAQDADLQTLAERVVEAIGKNDQTTLRKMFAPSLRAELPPTKLAPVMRQIAQQKGKFVQTGKAAVTDGLVIVEVEAQRGRWLVSFRLDDAQQLTELWCKEPAPRTAAEALEFLERATARARAQVTAKTPDPPRVRTQLSLPCRGEWYVYWGGDTEALNYHVTVRDQVRATDLVKVDAAGMTRRGASDALTDYYAYGEQVLSPADGRVISMFNDLPDNPIGVTNKTAAAGNHVMIQLAENEFAMLAHFQPRSIRVGLGDRVKRGQFLGLCGNSGNTTEPHIHFHVQDSAQLFQGNGLTPIIGNVRVIRDGTTTDETEYKFLRADRIVNLATEAQADSK